MLVHKGGKIKNWGRECRDVTPTKLQSQSRVGGGGGGGGGGVKMDVNEELKFFEKKYFQGGGRVGGGGGVRVDVHREAKFFVKIRKKIVCVWGGGVGSGGWVGFGLGWIRVDVNEELKFM